MRASTGDVAALVKFMSMLNTASDSNDVENAWGEFMSGWAGSAFDQSDSSGFLSWLIDVESILTTYVEAFASIGGYGNPLCILWNLATAVVDCFQIGILCYAYQLRLEWYIEDIDR